MFLVWICTIIRHFFEAIVKAKEERNVNCVIQVQMEEFLAHFVAFLHCITGDKRSGQRLKGLLSQQRNSLTRLLKRVNC